MRWGVRAALRGQLALGDQIRAEARDEITRDRWVVTDQEVIRIKGRSGRFYGIARSRRWRKSGR